MSRSVPRQTAAEDFEALVAPWVAEMYRAAAAIVGREDAADVTQDALTDAWRAFGRLRERDRIRAWLHAIVANRARKQIRSARSRPRLISVRTPADFERGGSRPDPASEIAERDRLDRAFDHLNADQRICLALRYSVDLTVPEIADALRIPEGTVKSRINAGITRLRVAIGNER